MDTQTELERGFKAQQLLDNEIYQESIQTVRDAIIAQWSESPIRDHEGQHELRLMLKLLNDLTANIKTVADTGKLAQIQVERDSKLKQIKRAAGF